MPEAEEPDRNPFQEDVGSYQFDRESGRVRINLQGSTYAASIEDFPQVMARVMDILMELDNVERVVLAQERDYEYNYDQVRILNEVASVTERLRRDPQFTQPDQYMRENCERLVSTAQSFIQDLIAQDLREDPIGAFVKIKRKVGEVKVKIQRSPDRIANCYEHWLENTLKPLKHKLEELELIKQVEDELAGYHVGNREIYRQVFSPTIRPNFMLTRYMRTVPEKAREVDRYDIDNVDTEVRLLRVKDDARPRYHITPPEFDLNDREYEILDVARRYMSEHKPEESEFAEPGRTREIFFNIGRDMVQNISEQRDVDLSPDKVDQLASILTRYTAGLGVLEVLLADQKLQDIYVNAPVGSAPIYVIHAEMGECQTNLVPTRDDVESWATRFRLKSGRPLDEANPVLDTSAKVPGGRARVAIVTRNLSPDGLAYAFRRHRSEPWTFPLYIDVDYLTPLAAGLLHFIIDGARSVLYAGTRSAGKSSLLGASLVELMKNNRIVSVEDSVTGDCSILYRHNGQVRYEEIGEVIDRQLEEYGSGDRSDRDILRSNPDNIEVLSMSDSGTLRWREVSLFMRHAVEKALYEVETRTGRKIRVTEDHSLFTMGKDVSMEEIKPTDLSEGDYIVTPRELDVPSERKRLNLFEKAEELEGYFVGLDLSDHRSKLKELSEKYDYSQNTVDYWIRESIIPAKFFAEMDIDAAPERVKYKHKRQSSKLPVKLEFDNEIMEFFGLWMADGCYDNRSVLVTVSDEKCREVVRNIFGKLGLPIKHHSDGHTLMANSTVLKEIMRLLGFEGDAYSKRIPGWIFSAAHDQRCAFLRGMYSGDGYSTPDEIGIDLINEKLIEDIQTLLLIEGIRGRARDSGKMRSMRISDLEGIREFMDKIDFLQDYKSDKVEIEGKISTHDTTDIIPLPRETIKALCAKAGLNTNDYINRKNQLGRQKLKEVVRTGSEEVVKGLKELSSSDIFWDEVKSVEKISREGTVYDVSVPGDENFVTSNILAHNTLELPLPYLQGLGYNIERLKSESVITTTESELSAAEAIRTSLRLGDSSLIVGEVRGEEAKALYEAMRVGALANYVAGTIHGESAYSVFDRVVNDLGVPRTSFKATDIIVTANRLTSPSGLHKYRRITSITEVRKEWEDDPLQENAFVPLMEYDAEDDRLKPTDTLLNGESMILNEIASNVREWKNNWDAVWNNIQLRADYKKKIVEYARQTNNSDLMEADFVARANEKFHTISEDVIDEIGSLDTEEVFDRWDSWMQNVVS
ncbi:MAG: ATPase, T2SS/T4P/T4SS family [Candidatus Nanohaloarchaea archaeon]|nr:ATPase, T2SS/T4P/T4SS family [Candidatus Nanohaloarchaea archaeon]